MARPDASKVKAASKTNDNAASAAANPKKRKATSFEEDSKAVSSQKSVLKDSKPSSALNVMQEVDFPRGAPTKPASGALAPTKKTVQPSEEKGLFDDGLQGSKKVTAKRAKDVSSETAESKSPKKRKVAKSATKSSKGSTSLPSTSTSASDSYRVEHLSYKRLLPGPTVLLVQIIQILPLELIVSLPNQLLGHIPITNISKAFTKRLEEEMDEDEEESEEEIDEEADEDVDPAKANGRVPSLDEMFTVGQYLRSHVNKVLPAKSAAAFLPTHTKRGNEDVKNSRRCELSLEPDLVNATVSKADLKKGDFVLQAYVKSVEDNGYILDFGLPAAAGASATSELTGFVSFKEEKSAMNDAGPQWPKHKFTLGGIVDAKILKVNENQRTCAVSVSGKDVRGCSLNSPPNLSSLLPGALVQGTITAITYSGLNLKFLQFFEGTVDIFHMLPSTTHTYKVGDKVKGRILWTLPPLNDSPVRFALSLLPHILTLSSKTAPINPGLEKSEEVTIDQVLPIGTFVENFKVLKVEPEWGILGIIPGTDVKVFVHISNVSDDHILNLSGKNQYKAGTEGHKGRVIGYSAFDGLLQLSLKDSVLNRRFMKVSDLQVGEVLEGTVQRLSDSALFVNIKGNVNGIVWPLHYSDIRLKHPERKFKPGGLVKTRVFGLDEEKNRIVLTLKRSLINSDLPILARGFEDAQVGKLHHAIVHAFLKKDMLVELFGGLKAYVPVAEASDKFVDDISKHFSLGQVVKVKLIGVEPDSKRLTASVKQALDTYDPSATESSKKPARKQIETVIPNIDNVDLNDTVSGIISDVHEQQVVLSLSTDNVKALLNLASLAKHRGISVGELRKSIEVGQNLEGMTVVSKNSEKGFVIVTFLSKSSEKSSLVPESTRTGISSNTYSSLLSFDQLSEGQILEGTISSDLGTQGYFVQLSKGIRGRLHQTELADNYDDVASLNLSKGSDIKCIILDFDRSTNKIELSLRKSRISGEDDESVVIQDPVVDDIEELTIGQSVRGFVKSVSDAGVFVELGKDFTARVQIKELFDDFVKDWKPKFSIGQLVAGKVLSTNSSKKQIEMTLRKTEKVKRTKTDEEPVVTFEGLSEGQVVKGIVKRLESYGAFIRIQGSAVSGLCHKSQISDKPSADWAKNLSVGDTVRAVITKLDVEKRKISFSMKPSVLPEAEEDEDNEVMKKLNELVGIQSDSSFDEDEDEEQNDSEDEIQFMMGSEDDEDEDEDASNEAMARGNDSDTDMADTTEAAPVTQKTVPLKLSAFKWDGQVDDEVEAQNQAASDSESQDSEDEAPQGKSTDKSVLVTDKTGDLAEQVPTSPSDFDRILLATPNSSYIWIQYMSYFIQLSNVEQAKAIAERALKTINYREEEEKLNIWMALINLDNSYGSDESLEETFNKAIQANDAKKVFLRTLEIYEQTQNFARAEQLHERFVKKFNMSSKAWTLYGQFLLNRSRSTDARDLLPRSLKSLPKRKHVKTISQFALLEFKHGEPERGRTVFEGIVDSYPKRLDLWWIYIDQEIRLKNVIGVRALFERVLAQKLSSKKTKSLLKKWLAFEKQIGDEAGAEHVKQKAIAYVEAMQN